MYYAIKNLLALIGLITLTGSIYLVYKLEPMYQSVKGYESKALSVYMELMDNLIETGNSAEATVWKVKVEEGLTADEVEETMKFVANEHNIKNVGELPLYKEVSAMTGEEYRYMKIFMFCNALTASHMADFSDAYTAYLPCRVSLVEDKQGQLWLYTLNMDPMIYGGNPLPPALRKEAIGVKKIMLDIMNRGAAGDF